MSSSHIDLHVTGGEITVTLEVRVNLISSSNPSSLASFMQPFLPLKQHLTGLGRSRMPNTLEPYESLKLKASRLSCSIISV